MEFEPVVGSMFISCHQAREIILGRQVSTVMQAYALDVYLTLKDVREVSAIETIDEVFSVVDEATPNCGTIPLATESFWGI